MRTIQTKCPECGKIQTVNVKEEDFKKWKAGTLIQYAFPYLTATEREAPITGICSACWDNMFKE